MCPEETPVDRMAETIIAGMEDNPGSDRVEWDQDGAHYLLRRTA